MVGLSPEHGLWHEVYVSTVMRTVACRKSTAPMVSVERVILEVFGSLERQFGSQPFASDLVYPDPG